MQNLFILKGNFLLLRDQYQIQRVIYLLIVMNLTLSLNMILSQREGELDVLESDSQTEQPITSPPTAPKPAKKPKKMTL